MAFSYALIRRNNREAVFDVTADNNADTGGDVAHGLGRAPENITITPLLAVAYTSQWCVTAIDATNITLTKTAGGGGDADPQLRVIAQVMSDLKR